MKTRTTQQFTNAFMTNAGPKSWAVFGKWSTAEEVQVMSRDLTYRQAKALARSIREAGGYADAVSTK